MKTTAIAAASVLAAAGSSAQVLSFSFASDGSSSTPTFEGSGSALGNFADASGFDLLIDDANGPLPTLEFADVSFIADLSLSSAGKTEIATGVFVHSYNVDGFFGFVDASDDLILSAEIGSAVMSVVGTESAWFTAGSIVASDLMMQEITYTWLGDDFAAYGLLNGQTSVEDNLDDGVFTLTLITDDATGGLVELDSDGLPASTFTAEASFSGSTRGLIPTPASFAMLTIGGLAAARRRR